MRNARSIFITNELMQSINRLAESYSAATGADPVEYYQRYYLDFAPHADVIYSVGKGLGITLTDRVLEVGSGLGTRCLLGTAIFGAEFVGLEPCANTYSNLKDAIAVLKESNKHLKYESVYSTGEDTGLDDETFDHVVSFEVIEHVQSPFDVFNEMYRVLKPFGKIFISTCNYASFYEGHFRSLLIPVNNKRFQKQYFRAINRNPEFIDHLNFITKLKLIKYLKNSGFINIKFHDNYAITHCNLIKVHYPDNICFDKYNINKRLIQKLIQSKPVHSVLKLFNREYKLYITAEKPDRRT